MASFCFKNRLKRCIRVKVFNVLLNFTSVTMRDALILIFIATHLSCLFCNSSRFLCVFMLYFMGGGGIFVVDLVANLRELY